MLIGLEILMALLVDQNIDLGRYRQEGGQENFMRRKSGGRA
jgi:hypothetical protein